MKNENVGSNRHIEAPVCIFTGVSQTISRGYFFAGLGLHKEGGIPIHNPQVNKEWRGVIAQAYAMTLKITNFFHTKITALGDESIA